MTRGRRVEHDVVVLFDQFESVSSAVNSSKAAISVVQAPDSCSSIPLMTSAGSAARTGSITRSRYCCAAACGSISSADRPRTVSIAVILLPMVRPNT